MSSASRSTQRFHRKGQVTPKPSGGSRASHQVEAHADLILATYEARPEFFLHELRDALAERRVKTSTSGLSQFNALHRITRKRGRSTWLSRRADVKAAREPRFAAQNNLDPDRLVFLGETAANTKMARRYGRAPRGQPRRMAVPHGHYATTTVTAALRDSSLTATSLFNGATNGARFRAYVADTPTPVLRPGDTVILDNLNVHKVAGMREAIEAAGTRVLYLPPCSLDFNPIEQAFAKLKHLLPTACQGRSLNVRQNLLCSRAEVRPQTRQGAWAAVVRAAISDPVSSSVRSSTCRPSGTDGINGFAIGIALSLGHLANQGLNYRSPPKVRKN